MSWWENVKGWSHTVYDNATATGMALYNNASLRGAASSTAHFTFNTVQSLFEQIGAIPKVAYSMVFHQKTRMVTGHVLRITLEDLLAFVLFSYAQNSLKQYREDCSKAYAKANWLSVDTTLEIGLSLLQLVIWGLKIRKQTQLAVRTTVLTIEAAKAFNHANSNSMTLCETEKCGTLRFLKGSFRDNAAFWATEGAISAIGYIPTVGEPIADILSTYHAGRYVLTAVLPNLCNRHQVEYLTENAELALSLGLGRKAMAAGLTMGFEHLTGVPAPYFFTFVNQAALLTSISIAAHMRLPSPVKESKRALPDPLAGYQSLVGFTFDTIAFGLKKQIPRLMKQPPSNIPWGKIANYVVDAWNHPLAKKAQFLIVPRMLRSKNAFINDPVIAPNWEGLRKTFMNAIVNIEEIRGHLVVQVAATNPKLTAKSLLLIFGTPKSVTELLLHLMGNEAFMLEAGRFRRTLETMYTGPAPTLILDNQALELRTETSNTIAVEESLAEEGKDKTRLTRDTFFKPPIEAQELLLKANAVIQKCPTTQLSAHQVIRRKVGFFPGQASPPKEPGLRPGNVIVKMKPTPAPENRIDLFS